MNGKGVTEGGCILFGFWLDKPKIERCLWDD